MHDQAVDEAGGAAQHEVGERGRVGRDHALDRRVRDVALVPQRHVLERRHGVAAQQARQARQVLAQDRVLLVRHRRGALLPLAERLLRLADLGALPVADLDRELLDGGAEQRQRVEELGVAIALHDLRGDGLGAQAERGERLLLDRRREVGVGADGAGDLADGDVRRARRTSRRRLRRASA